MSILRMWEPDDAKQEIHKFKCAGPRPCPQQGNLPIQISTSWAHANTKNKNIHMSDVCKMRRFLGVSANPYI